MQRAEERNISVQIAEEKCAANREKKNVHEKHSVQMRIYLLPKFMCLNQTEFPSALFPPHFSLFRPGAIFGRAGSLAMAMVLEFLHSMWLQQPLWPPQPQARFVIRYFIKMHARTRSYTHTHAHTPTMTSARFVQLSANSNLKFRNWVCLESLRRSFLYIFLVLKWKKRI